MSNVNPAPKRDAGMIKIASLWRETDRNGNTYLTGPMNSTSRLLIFATSIEAKAKNPKAPDFNVYLVGDEKPPMPKAENDPFTNSAQATNQAYDKSQFKGPQPVKDKQTGAIRNHNGETVDANTGEIFNNN